MNQKQIPLVLALVLALGVVAGCAQDTQPVADTGVEATAAATAIVDEHADGHAKDTAHDHASAEALGMDFPVPENHEPWAPDAPLIEGMSQVRTALSALEAHPDEATIIAHAGDVDAAIDYMFANCDLPTEPDVALHAVLARLMAGSNALKENPTDHAAVLDMQAAVKNYEQLFDDPNEAS